MTEWHIFKFAEFGGIAVHIPTDYSQIEAFALNIHECLTHIRRFPTGDILLNQIKHIVPVGVSTRSSHSELVRSIKFDIEDNVVIIPVEVAYMQSGYREEFGEIVPSSMPSHNPPGRPFWQRALTDASTEALDVDLASMPRAGSKSLIRFSNAIMKTNINTPAFIILAHELIHAAHNLFGHRWEGREEDRTTGVGDFAADMQPLVSENQLRREAGLPTRATYA